MFKSVRVEFSSLLFDSVGIENQQVEVVAAGVVPVGRHRDLFGGREVHELGDRGVDGAVGQRRPPFGRRDDMQEGHAHSLSDRPGEAPRRPEVHPL